MASRTFSFSRWPMLLITSLGAGWPEPIAGVAVAGTVEGMAVVVGMAVVGMAVVVGMALVAQVLEV